LIATVDEKEMIAKKKSCQFFISCLFAEIGESGCSVKRGEEGCKGAEREKKEDGQGTQLDQKEKGKSSMLVHART
jgi:hypothetical protein